jgi:amino acid transporter
MTANSQHEPQAGLAAGPAVPQAGTLAKGSLRTIDAIAISISVLSPAMAMQLNTGGVAAVAGGSTPLAFLLGGVACLALAVVVIGFTRQMASAGYAYTYASRSLGQRPGFVAGWLYAFGLACFVPMTMAGVGALTADLLHLDAGWWFVFFLIGMALLILLSAIQIRVTTKLQLLVGLVTVALFVIIDVVITAKGGAHGQALGSLTFSHTTSGGFHGVFYGLILGVTSYIGFETAADFGEETANPRKSIPIAVMAAIGFAIVFYVWTTYATTIGYGVPELAKDPSAWVSGGFAGVADIYLNSTFGTLVELGAMLSAFIVCVACATGCSRTLFAMSREGVLPAFLSKTSERSKSPLNATLVVAAASTVVAAIVGYGFPSDALGGAAFTVYALMATIGTLCVILVYMGLCVGGIVFFRKTVANFNPITHGIVPLVGFVIFGAALYGSIYPRPPAPLNWAAYVTIIWLVAGIAAVLYLASAKPAAIARIGSILGEEGGADEA